MNKTLTVLLILSLLVTVMVSGCNSDNKNESQISVTTTTKAGAETTFPLISATATTETTAPSATSGTMAETTVTIATETIGSETTAPSTETSPTDTSGATSATTSNSSGTTATTSASMPTTPAPGSESPDDFFIWSGTIITDLTVKGADAEEIIIPSKATELGASALSHSGASKIVIGPNVTIIGEKAFYYCSVITEITIPPSVKQIKREAFKYCDALSSITFSEGLEEIGEEAFCFINTEWTADTLMTITLPNTLTTLQKNAFQSEGIEAVYLPESVTAVAYKAINIKRYESIIYVKKDSWADKHFEEFITFDEDNGLPISFKVYY